MELPSKGLGGEALADRLFAARELDTPFLSGRVLGSMCTAPHPAALEAWSLFADTNLGDPLINPGAAQLEAEVVSLLASMVGGGPDSAGLFLSGGTEANITAMRLARDTTGRRTIVMPETAHFSFRKAAHALGLAVVTTPVNERYEADVDALAEAVDGKTAAVVGVAGNTEFGAVDDIAALAELASDHGAWMHVDAAYGGFILPFLDDPPPFGLDVEGVSSVTVDPHKMGRAPVPSGSLVVNDPELLRAGSTETPYVSTNWQAGLLSTRPGAAAAGTWAALHALGEDGYRTHAKHALHLAGWFARSAKNKGLTLTCDPPHLGIVGLATEDNEGARARLADKGWVVSLTTHVPGIRIVCMPHVTSERLTEFLRVLPRAMSVAPGSKA